METLTRAKSNGRSGNGVTILVVEDNPDVAAVAVAMLEELNYHTVTVDSGKAALNCLSAGTQVDLVFSDVVLPGDLDGLALAEAIRKRHPHVPVLLTSGYARVFSGRHGLPILRKPYEMEALAEAIRACLDSRAGGKG